MPHFPLHRGHLPGLNIKNQNHLLSRFFFDAYEKFKIKMIEKQNIATKDNVKPKRGKFRAFQRMVPWDKDININPSEIRITNRL